VHFRKCALGVVDFLVHDICGSTVDVEGRVHGHPQVLDCAVFSEDFADVVFFDVSSQCFHYDLVRLLDKAGF
jgi:hypothetical protein